VSSKANGSLTLNALQDPAVWADPYPLYHRLRTEDPVHWDEDPPRWVLTRYADVMAGLSDNRLSAARLGNAPIVMQGIDWDRYGPVVRAVARQMLFVDPPDHTRLRGLVSKAFTPRMVEQMRPRIQALIDRLLDRVEDTGQMDVIHDLAFPLPATVIVDMLGVPDEDQARFKQGSDEFARFLGAPIRTPEQANQILAGVADLLGYFRDIVASRRRSPREDLLSALIAAEEQGDRLDEEELFSNCLLLLAAGHETTTNLIGNGLWLLLRHPEQLRRLRDDPALAAPAIAELLRYEPPVHLTGRIAKTALTIGGQPVAAGERITFVLAAANRDPAQYPDPDRLDVIRPESRHASFGYGIHFCLGAPLARLEGQLALTTVLRRFPDLGLALDAPQWHESLVFRGLKTLPVTF
jgi:cytochrome P450